MEDFFTNPIVLVGFFAIACYVCTLITRKIVETAKPDLKKQADENDKKITYKTGAARWWNGVILYTIAPVFGVALALSLKDTQYLPSAFSESGMTAAMFGLGCGFLSGWFFKVFKKTLSKKTGVSEAELDKPVSTPPPPGGE